MLVMQIMKENETPVARPRTVDKGNWRRKHIVGRSANIEMDLLDARFTSSDIKRLDSCAEVFSQAGDANNFGDFGSEDSFIIEVVKKTQLLAIGRQEAETEVFLDKIVDKLGGQEQALLYVTSEINAESRVQLLVNTLLQRGANPSASDLKLRTPLHFAVKKNFRGVASKLLENDALPHARDRDGVLPLRIAIDNANDEIAALLLTYMSNRVVRSLFTSDGHLEAEFSFHFLLRSTLEKTSLSVLDCMIDPRGEYDCIRAYYRILEADENGRPPDDPLFQKKDWSAFQIIAKRGDKWKVALWSYPRHYFTCFLLTVFCNGRISAMPEIRAALFLAIFMTGMCLLTLSIILDVLLFWLPADQGLKKSLVYHDVVRLLIRRKWKGYARKRFVINSVMYALTLFSLTYSAITATLSDTVTDYVSSLDYSRAVFECISYGMACFTLLTECNQLRKNKLEYFSEAFNYIEFPSAVLLISVLPLRYKYYQEQWYMFAFGYVLWVLRIFKYAAIFRQTGAYAQILWRIITHDFIQFTAVFLVVLLGFSGSFMLSLKGDDNLNVHNDTSTFWGILFVGVRTLTAGEPVLDYTGPHGYKTISTILMVCFLFVTLVIMLNILIAQLSDTYQNVQADAQRGLEVNRAWNVARVELNSWFHGQRNRLHHYIEYEDISNIDDALEKWETPPLNEMNKCVRDIWETMDTHKMNLLTVKNRLAKHESTLLKIQNTLESISSKQNELLSCRCTCSKAVNTIQQTKDSEDDSNLLSTNNKSKDSADDYVNPDDINIIVPTSVTHLGSVNILQEQKTHDDRNPNHIRDSSQLITDDSHTEDNKVGQLWRIVKTSVDND